MKARDNQRVNGLAARKPNGNGQEILSRYKAQLRQGYVRVLRPYPEHLAYSVPAGEGIGRGSFVSSSVALARGTCSSRQVPPSAPPCGVKALAVVRDGILQDSQQFSKTLSDAQVFFACLCTCIGQKHHGSHDDSNLARECLLLSDTSHNATHHQTLTHFLRQRVTHITAA